LRQSISPFICWFGSVRSHSSRVTDGNRVVGHVRSNDGSGSYHRTFTNRHSIQDNYAEPEPRAITNAYSAARFQVLLLDQLVRAHAVVIRIESAAWSNSNMVSNRHIALISHYLASRMKKGIGAYLDPPSLSRLQHRVSQDMRTRVNANLPTARSLVEDYSVGDKRIGFNIEIPVMNHRIRVDIRLLR